jgi:hypothetical protein
MAASERGRSAALLALVLGRSRRLAPRAAFMPSRVRSIIMPRLESAKGRENMKRRFPARCRVGRGLFRLESVAQEHGQP